MFSQLLCSHEVTLTCPDSTEMCRDMIFLIGCRTKVNIFPFLQVICRGRFDMVPDGAVCETYLAKTHIPYIGPTMSDATC